MNVDWFKDARDNVEERKALVKASRPILKVLKNILDRKLKEAGRDAVSRPDYTDAAWAYVQADYNGYIRALEEIAKLVTPDPED